MHNLDVNGMDCRNSPNNPFQRVATKEEEVLEAKDAGALFVLESKGTWFHAGYHLTTAIAGPSLLTLPYALHFLGWGPGLLALSIAGAVSSYAYCLLSIVLEHYASRGKRCLRFRDLSELVIGRQWTIWFVIPVQFGVCFVTLIGIILTGGYGCKLIYLGLVPDGSIPLWVFIACFGGVMMILAQLPSFHSLRHLSLFSLFCCLAYSFCSVIGSITAGHHSSAPPKDYSVTGSPVHKLFGVFTAVSVMAGVYGVALIPEIQATLAPPVTGKMQKGIALCYTVVLITFYPVAISGYWAFGNQAQGNIIDNLVPDNGPKFLPTSLLAIISIAIVAQLLAIGLVYLQPISEVLESRTGDVEQGMYNIRNVMARLIFRTLYLAVVTLLAAMLPFFADIVALIGAFGYTPLDFILPMLFYQIVFQPSKQKPIFWLNWTIIVVFSIIGVVGCVASFRSIYINVQTYHLFGDV